MNRLQPESAKAQRRGSHARQRPQVLSERTRGSGGATSNSGPNQRASFGQLRVEALVGACVARREAGDLGSFMAGSSSCT